MTVRCRACHRVERVVEGRATEVVLVGGSRRPDGPPARAAWSTLRAAAEGELRVVGTCAACGQPLVAEPRTPSASELGSGGALPLAGSPSNGEPPEALAAVAYVIQLPDAALELGADGLVRVGGAPVHLDEAERRVHAAFPLPPRDLVADVVGGSMALTMIGPVVVWVMVVSFIVAFLTDLGMPSVVAP